MSESEDIANMKRPENYKCVVRLKTPTFRLFPIKNLRIYGRSLCKKKKKKKATSLMINPKIKEIFFSDHVFELFSLHKCMYIFFVNILEKK
jgi:hypothetical protein